MYLFLEFQFGSDTVLPASMEFGNRISESCTSEVTDTVEPQVEPFAGDTEAVASTQDDTAVNVMAMKPFVVETSRQKRNASRQKRNTSRQKMNARKSKLDEEGRKQSEYQRLKREIQSLKREREGLKIKAEEMEPLIKKLRKELSEAVNEKKKKKCNLLKSVRPHGNTWLMIFDTPT
jgi:predicted  nucleic acid-binding Zn-ribbon protein